MSTLSKLQFQRVSQICSSRIEKLWMNTNSGTVISKKNFIYRSLFLLSHGNGFHFSPPDRIITINLPRLLTVYETISSFLWAWNNTVGCHIFCFSDWPFFVKCFVFRTGNSWQQIPTFHHFIELTTLSFEIVISWSLIILLKNKTGGYRHNHNFYGL